MPTFENVMNANKLFDHYGIEYNVLCVLTHEIACHPQDIFNFLLKQNIRYIQFIPCLPDLNEKTNASFVLTSQQFIKFYQTLFDLWFVEFIKGNYISIKLFDDIIYLLRMGKPACCGMLGLCASQYAIESDGSVYPCDFYVLDEYKIGHIMHQTMFEMNKSQNLKKFLCTNKNSHSKYCQECPFYHMCYSGCKRMKNVMYLNEDETYCGYQAFLQAKFKAFQEIARQENLY
jgi:uncharacterized protein